MLVKCFILLQKQMITIFGSDNQTSRNPKAITATYPRVLFYSRRHSNLYVFVTRSLTAHLTTKYVGRKNVRRWSQFSVE